MPDGSDADEMKVFRRLQKSAREGKETAWPGQLLFDDPQWNRRVERRNPERVGGYLGQGAVRVEIDLGPGQSNLGRLPYSLHFECDHVMVLCQGSGEASIVVNALVRAFEFLLNENTCEKALLRNKKILRETRLKISRDKHCVSET